MNLDILKRIYKNNGCQRLVFKVLAANDNSKNQFYLGGDFTAVEVIPSSNFRQERNDDFVQTKRTKKEIFKADVNFSWLDERGKTYRAPNVQMILYPQYPEVRISGFSKGCKQAPSELIRPRLKGRILLFGICDDGQILGFITSPDSPLAKEIGELKDLKETGIFEEIPLTQEKANAKQTLLKELGRIHRKGFIQGQRLTNKGIVQYNASNAGGYTLEAELGITPNCYAEPDYLGWELKQHKVNNFEKIETGVITLMTPEPTEGYYRKNGVEAFIRKYGQPDMRGRKDRLNFGGTHYVNKKNIRTGLTLALEGYDPETGKITQASGGICLMDNDNIAAKWPFTGIINHWKRKHSQAAYIPSLCEIREKTRFYWYGPLARLCEGTDILLLLKAMYNGHIYYDPGIKLENVSTKPKSKRRSQFRIHSKNIENIYRTMTKTEVLF